MNLKLFIPRSVTGTGLVPIACGPASMSPLADPDWSWLLSKWSTAVFVSPLAASKLPQYPLQMHQELHCGHSTMNAMYLLCTFFSLILILFSQTANHSRKSMQRPRLFPTLFSKWCHDFKQRRIHFSNFFSDFLSITVVPLPYKSGILYQWNYNCAFSLMEYSCFPTTVAINSLCARDQIWR